MPIATRRPKSTPSICSRKPCTKCWRACSPSLTMSIPASSCSFTANTVASRFASARASPSTRHGAHSTRGSASQDGFGRLPAIVVSSIAPPPRCCGRQRSDCDDRHQLRAQKCPGMVEIEGETDPPDDRAGMADVAQQIIDDDLAGRPSRFAAPLCCVRRARASRPRCRARSGDRAATRASHRALDTAGHRHRSARGCH